MAESVVLLAPGDTTEVSRVDGIDGEIAATWRSNHFVLIGESRFLAPLQSEAMVVACGTSHGATHATYSTKYVRTDRDVVPVDRVTPTTRSYSGMISTPDGEKEFSGTITDTYVTTWMMPYNVDIFRHEALFWARRAHTPPLGIVGRGLTPTESKSLGRNTGVVVEVVLKETPAFFANILVGDCIERVNETLIATPAALTAFLEQQRGKEVIVQLKRDGAQHRILVTLAF